MPGQPRLAGEPVLGSGEYADPPVAQLQQVFGNVAVSYNSGFYGLFAQDDWQIAPRLKLLYGVRYDLFDVPSARPFAANPEQTQPRRRG